MAKVARKDADGKRVKEVVDGKKVTVYDEVEKTIKKDKPSRLHARRQMLKVLFPVKEGEKRNMKDVDMVAKLFDEIAPKYADRNGGYTRSSDRTCLIYFEFIAELRLPCRMNVLHGSFYILGKFYPNI